MRFNSFVTNWAGIFCCFYFIVAGADSTIISTITVPAQFETVNKKIQPKVNSYVDQVVRQQAARINNNAAIAYLKTRQALLSIEKSDRTMASKYLDQALFELNQLTASYPRQEYMLAQTNKVVNDDLTDFLDINNKKREIEAQWQLEHMQVIRQLLKNFTSEVVITTQSIPVKKFIQGITEMKLLLNQERVNDAKLSGKKLLNFVRRKDYTIPLPLFRAELMLQEAEHLAREMTGNRQVNKAKLQQYLNNTAYQLNIAKALGYGEQKHYGMCFQAIEGIKKLVDADQQITEVLRKFRSAITNHKNEVIDELSELSYN